MEIIKKGNQQQSTSCCGTNTAEEKESQTTAASCCGTNDQTDSCCD